VNIFVIVVIYWQFVGFNGLGSSVTPRVTTGRHLLPETSRYLLTMRRWTEHSNKSFIIYEEELTEADSHIIKISPMLWSDII
jgi:hypothetical protein